VYNDVSWWLNNKISPQYPPKKTTMDWSWISALPIAQVYVDLGKLVKYNSAHKDLLVRELRRNIKAFKTAERSRNVDYDTLLSLLRTEAFENALKDRYPFSKVKRGRIESKHIFDKRNQRYIGKSADWMFKNIDSKIIELRDMYVQFGSLQKVDNTNIALHFTNLFYKMKLLADFISKTEVKKS
jgi:hypothetical protein